MPKVQQKKHMRLCSKERGDVRDRGYHVGCEIGDMERAKQGRRYRAEAREMDTGIGSEWMSVENGLKLLESCTILCFNFKKTRPILTLGYIALFANRSTKGDGHV